jgi:D-aminoacyl-tRNA deacylase
MKAEEKGIIGQYEVSYEATHHGPTNLSRPIVFFEIGSSIQEWNNEKLHQIMAEVAFDTIRELVDGKLPECKRAVGFGGGHYSRRFTKLTLTNGICFGHIVPKYILREGLSQKVLEQVFTKNFEGITSVYFEKKSAVKHVREWIRGESSRRGLEFHFI